MRARLLIVAACLATASCAIGAKVEPADDSASARHSAATHVHADPGADLTVGGMSVYQLGSEWTDQHGAKRRLIDLRGRPQLIAMVYTHCASACPRIINDMKRIETGFPDVGFVLVSIDPARDTTARLRAFASGLGLGERWTLLSGDDDALAELAAGLGVRYRPVSGGDFVHSNVITLLDQDGVAIHRRDGFGQVAATADAIARARH